MYICLCMLFVVSYCINAATGLTTHLKFNNNNNNNNNNNSIQFFIIYVPSQQLQGQLQTQHNNNNNFKGSMYSLKIIIVQILAVLVY
jgi:hypothetical protein